MEETFGARLVRLRQKQGWNQGELASKTGVRQSLISMLESGTRKGEKLTVDNALALAAALQVSVEYLILGQQPKRQRRKTACSATAATA